MSFTLAKESKLRLPKINYQAIAEEVLGHDYDLGLIFCTATTMRKLNRDYRRKDKVSNILSFPYSKKSGDIFINPERAKFEVPDFGENIGDHLKYLFIHGLLHLKGMTHGSKMERREKQLVKLFSR